MRLAASLRPSMKGGEHLGALYKEVNPVTYSEINHTDLYKTGAYVREHF